MNRDEIRTAVIDALRRVAPEVDAGSIEPSLNIRDQVDLDSMDFLNFVVALHERLKVEIPESDYPRLSTLDGAVEYLAGKTGL